MKKIPIGLLLVFLTGCMTSTPGQDKATCTPPAFWTDATIPVKERQASARKIVGWGMKPDYIESLFGKPARVEHYKIDDAMLPSKQSRSRNYGMVYVFPDGTIRFFFNAKDQLVSTSAVEQR